MTITRIAASLALLVGLGFAIHGYLSYRRGQTEYRDWVETTGELIGTRMIHDTRDGYLYHPKVRFVPAGGEAIEAEVIFPTDRSRDRGEAKVWYDRTNPSRVALSSSVWQRKDNGKNGMIGGGFFVVVGLLGLVFGGRRKR